MHGPSRESQYHHTRLERVMSDGWTIRIERTEWWGPIRYCIAYSHGWKKLPMEFAFTKAGAIRKAHCTVLRYNAHTRLERE